MLLGICCRIVLRNASPEVVELKKKVFAQLDELADEGVILASSSSCIVPSKFTEQLRHRNQCIVAHPSKLAGAPPPPLPPPPLSLSLSLSFSLTKNCEFSTELTEQADPFRALLR